jgi:glutamate synthase domain-containing protein 3
MIDCHANYTGSEVASQILSDWPSARSKFIKVMPIDYKRVITERQEHDESVESVLHEEQPGESTAVGR